LSRELFKLFASVVYGYTIFKELIIREGKDSSEGTDSRIFVTNEAASSSSAQIAFVIFGKGYEEDD
jgi:hypothetical protein